MEIKRILVIGGEGYIGKAIVKKLTGSFDVVVMDKRKSLGKGDKFIIGDLMDKESLQKIDDFDLVINLASVVRTIRKKKYTENVSGLKNLVEVLEEKKTKLIYFSTQNVNLAKKGYYGESKKNAEEVLKNSNLDYMIIRPNFVYEIGKRNDFYKMARIIDKLGFSFIIGDGKNKMQPVLREDLAGVVVEIVENFKAGKIIEISGKENVSINEIIELISKSLGKNNKRISVPLRMLKPFKTLIPFDVDGFDEDRVSEKSYGDYEFSSFRDDLEKIVLICKGELKCS